MYYINRQPPTTDGTFGALTDSDGKTICVTGELPWLNNAPQVSCIPCGTYDVGPHDSPAHPNTWEILNVPNRSEILLHNLNWPIKQSLGCIGVGQTVELIEGELGISNSEDTLNILRSELPQNFTLTIQNNSN